MAKRIFNGYFSTFTATATNAQATSGQYMALKGGASTQIVDILEVFISGTSTSSTVCAPVLTYASTLETGGASALASPNSDSTMNINATALSSTVTAFVAAVTNQSIPSNSATVPHIAFGLNTFGGIVRWNAAPTQQWTQIGNSTNGGESVLFNSSTHGGSNAAVTANIIYEPY